MLPDPGGGAVPVAPVLVVLPPRHAAGRLERLLQFQACKLFPRCLFEESAPAPRAHAPIDLFEDPFVHDHMGACHHQLLQPKS